MVSDELKKIYDLLYERFGPQYWWPGDTTFEIIISAILTQNTNWTNVEEAIANLKSANALSPGRIHEISQDDLAVMIRPAGYFNIKAKRIKNFLNWLFENYAGRVERLANVSTSVLREQLLSINGIGPETADSILLYGLEREIFVVDAYTSRITTRHGLIEPEHDYQQLQQLFEMNLPTELKLFNEYHGLLVRVGKKFCKTKPLCENCPLNCLPHQTEVEYF